MWSRGANRLKRNESCRSSEAEVSGATGTCYEEILGCGSPDEEIVGCGSPDVEIWGLWGPRGSFGTMEIPRKRRIVDDRNHEIVPSSDTTQENS